MHYLLCLFDSVCGRRFNWADGSESGRKWSNLREWGNKVDIYYWAVSWFYAQFFIGFPWFMLDLINTKCTDWPQLFFFFLFFKVDGKCQLQLSHQEIVDMTTLVCTDTGLDIRAQIQEYWSECCCHVLWVKDTEAACCSVVLMNLSNTQARIWWQGNENSRVCLCDAAVI